MFNFGHFSPLSVTTPNNFDLNDLVDTLLADEGIAATPPLIQSLPFQIVPIVPLNSNDLPPATDVEVVQQKKISTAEKSAKELETILNVAESGIQSIINELKSPSSPLSPPAQHQPVISELPPTLHDMWRGLNETLEDEFENPEFDNYDTQTRVMQHEQMSAANNISTENLYDDLLDHNNSPLPRARHRPSRPPAKPPQITGYVAHKKMPLYVPHKKMLPSPPNPTMTHSVSSSPIPQPRMKHYGTQMSPHQRRGKDYGTQMSHVIRTHNKIQSIFEDCCKGKTNTRHTTYRIMDIAHQVAKDNIR